MSAKTRTVAALAALGVVVPLATTAGAATAPAAGAAETTANLLKAQAFGKTIVLGTVRSVASTVDGTSSLVEFVPVTIDGVKTGAVSVGPKDSPKSVPAQSSSAVPGVPATLLAITSPAADLAASDGSAGPESGASAVLGSIRVLGANLIGDGTVELGSLVDGTAADAGKLINVSDIALPSLLDIINGLGIDLSALPVSAVEDLLESLPGTLDAVVGQLLAVADAAQGAVDTAQAAVDSASAQAQPAMDALDAATAQAAAADAALAQAQAASTAAQAQLANALSALIPPMTVQQWEALTQPAKDAIATANPSVASAVTASASAAQAVTTAQSTKAAKDAAVAAAAAVVATAQVAIDAAQDALDAVAATLVQRLQELLASVNGLLDGSPLASIGEIEVSTGAHAGKTAAEGTSDVTGSISDVNVLGADVLSLANLPSTVDVVGTASSVLTQIQSQVQGLLAPVFQALDGAIPGLKVPTPSVSFLTKDAVLGKDGAFFTAANTVSALTVSLPPVEVPELVALPQLPTIPGVSEIAGNVFKTAAMGFTIGELSESARFRPAALGAPGTNGAPNLPVTGGPAGVAVLALGATAAALIIRRKAALAS